MCVYRINDFTKGLVKTCQGYCLHLCNLSCLLSTAKWEDNRFGSIRPSVRLFVCLSMLLWMPLHMKQIHWLIVSCALALLRMMKWLYCTGFHRCRQYPGQVLIQTFTNMLQSDYKVHAPHNIYRILLLLPSRIIFSSWCYTKRRLLLLERRHYLCIDHSLIRTEVHHKLEGATEILGVGWGRGLSLSGNFLYHRLPLFLHVIFILKTHAKCFFSECSLL